MDVVTEFLYISISVTAKANSILTETLTDKVLKKQLIDKWNWEMPKVVGKGNVLLNIE